jgi:hypothetical protein
MKVPERPCPIRPQLRSLQNVLQRSVEPATQLLWRKNRRGSDLGCGVRLVAGRRDPELNHLRPSPKVGRQCLRIFAVSAFDRHAVFELLATLA